MSQLNDTEDTEYRVSAGDAAILSIPPLDTYPPPSVTWKADDGTLLYGIKYANAEPTNQFIILNTANADSKSYR